VLKIFDANVGFNFDPVYSRPRPGMGTVLDYCEAPPVFCRNRLQFDPVIGLSCNRRVIRVDLAKYNFEIFAILKCICRNGLPVSCQQINGLQEFRPLSEDHTNCGDFRMSFSLPQRVRVVWHHIER